jgi:hypothetical protein
VYRLFSRFVPNYRSEGQVWSLIVREVLGNLAAVGRGYAGTKYRMMADLALDVLLLSASEFSRLGAGENPLCNVASLSDLAFIIA